jgi:hypothetical protein
MRKGRCLMLATVVLASLAIAPSSYGSPQSCEEAFRARVTADSATIAKACSLLRSNSSDGIPEIPTVALAWPAAEVVNTSGQVGFAVSGICLYFGVITGTNTAQHFVVGSAQSAGPALSTTITCTVGPAGLSASGTLIGPASAAADTGPAALRAQRVCTRAVGDFIDNTTTDTRTKCSPALV